MTVPGGLLPGLLSGISWTQVPAIRGHFKKSTQGQRVPAETVEDEKQT